MIRNISRYGYVVLITIFVLSIALSCSSNSSETYSIEGNVIPAEAGNVTPQAGEYEEGAQVEIRAEPNETWMFSSWEGDISGTDNPVVVTIDENMVFTALFKKLQFPLNITVDGGALFRKTS